MAINYCSTRDASEKKSASQAILQGLSKDGGLFVPEQLPAIKLDFHALAEQSYQEVALKILSAFLTDFSETELKDCIDAAYGSQFEDPRIAPVSEHDGKYFLELFHGPTIAFKDLALQILPHLMRTAAKKNHFDKEIVILTATSGDTGKAALEGFKNVAGTQIIVFYPQGGVSPIQEKQMVTTEGDNTYVVAVDGNFDDAQTQVKKLLNDPEMREKMAKNGKQFSSANSINIGRLVPQVVYYVYAYAQLVKQGTLAVGETLDVSVPTGNFGNILAAYYAKKIGVPLGRLICASNQNKVLTDFFATGTYDVDRPFYLTTSPSMDILVSSNLERLVYYLTAENPEETAEFMAKLARDGEYTITEAMKENWKDFYGAYADERETAEAIHATYQNAHYVIDPHTAVAVHAADEYRLQETQALPLLVVSTASAYKFPQVVYQSLFGDAPADDFAAADKLAQKTDTQIPKAVSLLIDAPIRHNETSTIALMGQIVKKLLHLS